MPRQIQLVILCEDQQQAFFARHYFIQRGIRQIILSWSEQGIVSQM